MPTSFISRIQGKTNHKCQGAFGACTKKANYLEKWSDSQGTECYWCNDHVPLKEKVPCNFLDTYKEVNPEDLPF